MEKKMGINKKIFVLIPLIVLLMAIIVATIFFFPFTYQNGKVSTEIWSESSEFSLGYTVELSKSPDKDFVVLNLADVQVTNASLFNGDFNAAQKLITKMVEDKKPDLITLTGDNVAGGNNYLALMRLTSLLDSFNIPWAPVMGNHDNDGSGDYNWVADIFMASKNCIMKKGPAELGVGNYVISIMEGNNIVQALIMMTTHDTHVWDNQQSWYSWVVNGLNTVAGHTVDTTVMFHIPLNEYVNAWDYWVSTNYDESIGCGQENETVCCDDTNNGFFTLIKSLGSTKNVVCGHDHINTFSIIYEGVRLTYAIKSSPASYNYDSIQGGTILNISSTDLTIEQYFPQV